MELQWDKGEKMTLQQSGQPGQGQVEGEAETLSTECQVSNPSCSAYSLHNHEETT